MIYQELLADKTQAMGEWGSEEQLLAWGREGEGLFEGEGIRRPKREEGWVDILDSLRRK